MDHITGPEYAYTAVTAGVDIGSTMTKAVVLQGDRVVGKALIPTGADHKKVAESALNLALRETDLTREEIVYLVGTGYGRVNIPFADKQVTEITCHAKCIAEMFPGTGTIIEIGGQDSKAIRLSPEGKVEDFVMNEKCAAGTGRFLQMVASTFGISLEEMNQLAMNAPQAIPIHNFCAVLAQQEIISLLSRDYQSGDILAGLFESFAHRIVKMAATIGISGKIVLTGGGSKHPAFQKVIQRELNKPVLVPEEPFMTGAIGAAILARERYKKRVRV